MSTTRVFATIEAFRLACPICARISVIEPDGPKRRRTKRRTKGAYNRVRASWDGRHQILKCAWCNATWIIGLVVRPQSNRKRERPADIVPNRRELAQLRNLYGGGWWIDTPHKGDESVNLYLKDACTCSPLPWSEHCPIHGTERIGDHDYQANGDQGGTPGD